MSFISRLLKGYQIDTPVTTKEYIENKALQGNKTIGNIKNKSEFIEDVDISFPQLWYMFNHTDKLKNYGVQQINYDTTTTITSNNITEKHIKYTGSGITQLNKYIIQDLQNDFTISFWCKGSGIVFRVYYSTTDYIKLEINTDSISMNGTSVGSVTLDITQYNHIVLINQSVYVNNIKIGNITLPAYVFDSDNDIITLDSTIEYYDLRIFNKLLTDDKITKLYNLGNNSSTNSTIGDAGTYSNKISNFDINANGANSISIVFWINIDNVNNDIINYGDLKIGVKDKRFYTETVNKNNVFSNRKLTQESRYYFVCVVIENVGNSHILKLYIDNFPVIGKKFKDTFTFTNETDINGNNIENLLIYNRTLDDSEIMDLYIRDTKLNEIISDNLTDLYSDFSKNIEDTDESLYNLQLHSEFGVSSSGNSGSTEETTTEETSVYDIYKFNKYSGYVGFKDDLYAWYKFEKSNTEPITSIAPNMIDSSNCYLAFKHDGSTDNQTSYTVNFPEDTICDILIVGGGGGGGSTSDGSTIPGSGGGAGGLIFLQNQTIAADTYIIKVGKGGNRAVNDSETGQNGNNSSFNYLQTEAIGGGGGGSRNGGSDSIATGKSGGSGGGGNFSLSFRPAGSGETSDIIKADGTTIIVSNHIQGNVGGSIVAGSDSPYAGGGGGAGGRGQNNLENPDTTDGDGGIGKSGEGSIDFKTHFGITNTNIGEHHSDNKVYFAGGGSAGETGGNENTGGLGGGGDGHTDELDKNGKPNTGGGGAGSKKNSEGNGGSGGSGIVIIRYSSTKTTENAIDSNTNELQIPAGSVITKTIGTFSPYSLYWDGDLNDNTDNSYLTSSLSNLTPPLSISFWKKQDKLVSEETLSITDKLSLSINSNLAVKFSVGSTTEIIENQADLDWHFWTITSDGTENKLYRDGRELGGVINESLTLLEADKLMIGSNLSGQNDASPSYLEDLRIWKKSLTHQQIIDCMSIYPGYKNHASDLYLWYKFEDHPWNTSNIKDYSGDKRDGTITNYISSETFDDGYPIFPGHENNLKIWLKFDDDFTDSSGNGNDLTKNSGTSSFSTDTNRGQKSINNSSGAFTFSKDPIPTGTKELSFAFWIKTSDTDAPIIRCLEGDTGYLIRNYSGNFQCSMTNVGSIYKNTTLSDNVWHHVCFTLSIVEGKNSFKVYMDGVNETNDPSWTIADYGGSGAGVEAGYLEKTTTTTFLYIASQYFNGYLDDFRIYDKALSPDEVKQIYGYTLSRQQGRISPYAYFFNGSTANDVDNAYITKDTITDFPSTFSIAFWKKCLDKSVEGKSFVLSTASTNVIEIDVSNTVNFTIGDSSNILEDYNDVSWHHWVFTYSGTEMDIYKDGMNRVGHMINKKTGLTALDFTTVDHTIYVGGNTTGDASPSYLEDFRIYNKVLSGIEIQQVYSEWTGDIVDKKDNLKLWYQLNNNPVGIPDYPIFAGHESNLVAWYKFDGDLTDSSGNGNHLTAVVNGNDFQDGKIDKAILFNSDRTTEIRTTNNFQQINQDSSVSVSVWVKLVSIDSTTNIFTYGYSDDSNTNEAIGLKHENTNKFVYFIYGGTENSTTNTYTQTDKFYHIVLTVTQGNQKIYVDGVLAGSFTDSTNFDTQTSKLHIGYGTPATWSGLDSTNYLDDFRIYDKALSETEIKQIYGDRSKFDNGYVYNYANTSPYFDGVLKNVLKNTNSLDGYPGYKDHENDLIAWYKFDGDFTDSSGNNYDLTLTSGTVSTSATNVLIGSGSFKSDDTLNYKLSLPTTIDLRNTDFTISIWFNINKKNNTTNIINFTGSTLATTQYKFYTRDTGHRVRVIRNGPDGNSDSGEYGSVTGSTSTVGYAFELNQWYLHTFTLTNTEIKEYLNGSLIETRTTNVSHYTDPFTEMYIGTNNTTENFSGYLDDFRIYDKALSDFEIKQIYSGYTVSREKGHVSPYSYYWNGSTTDNDDNAYIEAIRTATPMTDITDTNSFTISYYKKLEGTVAKSASLSPDFNILSGSTNRISVGVNSIIETFTYTSDSPGLTGQTQYDITFTKDTICDILIVGGGGGGGSTANNTSVPGSGGGAGGLIFLENQTVDSGTYTIKVGKGGNKAVDYSESGQNGYNSSFSYLQTEAIGGGGGGSRSRLSNSNSSGNPGGSGGGGNLSNSGAQPAGSGETSDIIKADGTTIIVSNHIQGNVGGSIVAGSDSPYAGGGGGAGGRGQNNLENPDTTDGDGGIGKSGEGSIDFKTLFGITDTTIGEHHSDNKVYFAGGGSAGETGGNENTGGLGGGGDGHTDELDKNGKPNTGGGGAGSKKSSSPYGNGGNGGSGIVIIRYSKQHIKLNDISYETNVAFDLNVWYRWTFTYDGTNAKIYMMNIGNTALTPISEELTPTFTGWTDETFDKVLIGGGNNSIPDVSPAYLEDIRMYNTSFTEEDVKNLSLYNIPTTTTVSSGSGTVDLSGVGTGSYVLKLPEAPYGGYKDHINDLIVWYKFEKTPNGELRNYGKDSTYYGIVNNSGIAKPELVFSDSSGTVDTKFRLLELENNKLDKIHILDTDLKYDGTGDSNITYTVTPTSNINVDILVVGGGGGGGLAGAGGADVEYIQNYELTAGTEYTFKVGKGGDIGNIGGPSEMSNISGSIYKVLGGGNGGSPPIASATSGGGLVLTDPLEYHSPLLALGKGFTGGNYYYECNLDGTLINYAGGGGGASSSGTDATTLGGGKGGAGLYYSITTINTEYGKGGDSFEAFKYPEVKISDDSTFVEPPDTILSSEPLTDMSGETMVGPFDINVDNKDYVIYTFKYNSSYSNLTGQTEYSFNLDKEVTADILIVGGGGSGGSDRGGGGGAGSCIVYKDYVMNGNYKIKVGKGALKGVSNANGNNGNDSDITNQDGSTILFKAKGGGGGGRLIHQGLDGGCGGGGGSQGTGAGGMGGNFATDNIVAEVQNVSPSSSYNYVVYGNIGGRNTFGWVDNYDQLDGAGGGGIGEAGTSSGIINAVDAQSIDGGKGGDGLYKATINGIEYNFKEYFSLNGKLESDGYYYIGGGGGGGDYASGSAGVGGKGGGGAGGEQGYNGYNAISYGSGGGGAGGGGSVYLGGDGSDGIVIIRFPKPSLTTYTPPITSSLPATIIKPTLTKPTLVKNNINEVYYEFTAQETIQFIETISTTVFVTNGTDMIEETITFEPHKSYVIDPTTPQITTTDDSSTNIISALATGTTSTITGESLSYDNPTIIIKYSRLTTYEYGKGGDLNTTGNSGAIIIRYNYYDQTANPERVILQKPGYLNPYSYVWRGNATQPIDDSYISINEPAGILNNQFLSINFWLERDTTTTSKDYIFAITEHNPYNELLGIGLDSSNLFVNILGSSNTTPITSTDTHCHYSVEIDYSANTYAVYTTTIANEARLDTDTTVSTITLVASTSFIPTITFESSNLYSKEIKATIGDIFDDNIVDYELSPHGIEDFRIYNKTLTSVIADVAPANTTKYHTLFMSGYKASSATGVIANVNTDVNIDLEFYNLQPVDGGILKNIGNRTSEFNVLIHNNTYSNQDVITNKIIDAEATEVLQGKYGFEWNKIESVFEKNYYEGENIALEISDLKIISDYSVSFDLTLKADITTYPVEIINKNNEFVVRMNNATTIVVSYFLDKVKYFKEITINALVVDTKKSFDIVIDKDTNDVSFKVDAGASITANVVDDLKVWYQFEDDKTVKNYSKSSYSNLELNVESNIGFISSLSSDIDVDYTSPYSYYTFLPGDHSFKVENEMKCDMLMVGGGGMKLKRVSKTEIFEYTGAVEDWTKPEGVKEVTAYVWGAGGGGTGYGSRTRTSFGGGGGFVKASLNISNLDSLALIVGGGGTGYTSTGTVRIGGFLGGGSSTATNHQIAGSGGGLSGIFKNDANFVITDGVLNISAESFIIAGGGGGAGDNGEDNSANGGGGGGGGAGLYFTNGRKGQDRKQNNNFLSDTGGDDGTNSTFKYSAGEGVYAGGSGSGYYGGLYDTDNENTGLPSGGGGSSYWGGNGVTYIGDIAGTHNTNSQQSYSSLISFEIDANIGIGSASSTANLDGGNGLIILEYKVNILKSPGCGGGEVKLYNELILQPGDYTVTVGEGGYDTTLSSNSVLIYKALSGNLNNGGKAELNSNANVDVLHGFKGGDGYYESNVDTGIETTYAGGGGGMGSAGESATSTSGGKGGIGIYHSLNPYGISYEYGAGGNAIGKVEPVSTFISDLKIGTNGSTGVFEAITSTDILKNEPVEVLAGDNNVIGPFTYEDNLIYTFKYNSTHDNLSGQTEYSLTFAKDVIADILIVGGGGGGGGANGGGGGGAGGLVFYPNIILNTNIIIKVGRGGNKGANTVNGDSGKDSSIIINSNTISAVGGGGGGQVSNRSGLSGGSGGGMRTNVSETQSLSTQLAGIDELWKGYGNNGGFNIGNNEISGGGGGAGEMGYNNYGHKDTTTTTDNGALKGRGGDGLSKVTINGIIYNFKQLFGDVYGEKYNDENYFAGGGGGSVANGASFICKGGYGGGASSASGNDDGNDGVPNTGGGGSGGNNGSASATGGAGGSGIVIIRFSRYDKTPLQPNYGLYTVLPWNQHQLTDIKDIVSFKVWNQTTSKYELPTTDFVFDKELMDMSITPNYTGLYTFVDTDDEYYLYTFKYLDTIPVQTFEYKLTADGMTAYIFEKSHDRKTYLEGNNKDITIYVGDTVKFINNSGGHSLAIKDSADADIATESATITEYTFDTAGDYSYYCVSHPVMTGNITVIDRPTDNYDNSLGQTAYQLDIKRNVNADILIVSNTNAKEYNTIQLSGTMSITVGNSSAVSTYDASSDSKPITSSILGTSSSYNDPIVIIRFSKSNLENVLTNFGRGANAGQHATPGLLVLKTDNNQILTTETTKHPKLPYSYVWSGKTDTATDQVLVKSTEDFTIPTNLTLTFWYYESVNDDEKTEIIKIADELKVSSTTTDLVFTVGDSNVNIPRPNKYEWNFYGLIFNGTDANVYVYVNDMLVKTETVVTAPTGSGKITLGISTSGVAKIADYRIYESIDVLNISEQYSSLGNVGILDVFGNHLTEYDVKENKAGKGYLSLNQNNVKTKIFNNEDIVIISYKFKGIEADKYYPIIQFTDYINGIIVPKVEITMKINKLFVSVIIDNSIIEKEYVIDCTNLKSYSITINTNKTIVVSEDESVLTHTPVELIGLYSFENNDTTNDQIIENLVGETILSNMTICNIELSTKVISGTTNESNTEIITDDQTYHYYEIKESGSMTFAKETRVDMVLVGGGAGGGASNVGTEYYGEPGEVNVISTYLEGTYQIEIGSGGESNMPGTKSTIVDTNTGLEVYSANGGLTNVEYIDYEYSNVYSTYDFGDGEKKFAGYGINIPGVDVVLDDPVISPLYTEERMYPPTRNLTSASHTISGEVYGNGVYITEGSAVYNSGSDVRFHAYAVFNNTGNYADGPGFVDGKYTNGVYNNTDNIVGDYNGDYIIVELPVKIRLTKYGFRQRSLVPTWCPGFYKIYGSNDKINWDVLIDNNTTKPTYTNYEFLTSVNIIQSYKYFGLVVNELLGTASLLNFDEWYIYGKEQLVEPQPIAGTTDYKTLTFTHQLQCYPPATHLKDDTIDPSGEITTYTHNVLGADYGDGDYIITTSSSDSYIWLCADKVFSDKTDTTFLNRVSFENNQYHNPGDQENSVYSLGGFDGDYIKIQFPEAKILQKMRIYISTSLNARAPGVFKIFGSNNGSSWTEIYHQSTQLTTSSYLPLSGSGVNYPFSSLHEANISYYEFNISNNTNYLHYAMVVNKITGDSVRLDFIYLEFLMMVEYELTFDNPTECDILIVGGGGGGGSPDGGGGGGGGLIYLQNQTLTSGNYNIKVGKGGTGGIYPSGNPGQKGNNSYILGVEINEIAIGGGGGGQGYPADIEPSPAGGGSSGGLSSSDTNRDALNVHIPGQGNSGGLGDATRGGGGGGGAGASGNNGGSGTSDGLGGDGLEINITGQNTYYAGGGGGGHAPNDVDKAGGQGGGGLGKGRGDGNDGEPNTGGGGGGGGAGGGNGGDGGSGIVIIRYKTTTEQEPDILYPGTGGKTELPGASGILALREYRSSEQQYSISRTTGYNLPYSYQWSGITNEHSDKNYLYSIVNSTSFLNTDFIIGFWCYLNNIENISLLSIPDVLKIYISNQTLIFELSDGKATTLIKRNEKWQHLTFVRSNNSLEIYIDNVNKSKLLTKVSVDIVDSSTTLYINKSTTIIDNFIDPIKISDLRIYNNSSKYIIDKLANLPKEQYCYIGANQITDIAPSVLSEFKVNNSSTTALTDTTITYHPVTLSSISGGGGTTELNEITINTIVGNESLIAYEWSNLEQSESLKLSNLYMSINNGKDLINKCYTGFEFSTSYWCKFGTSCNIYELQLLSTEHTILELKHNVDNLLELSFDITTDSNQSITTILDQTLLQDHWYLIGITAGISDKYVSLSLGVYDATFDGSQGSYISSSILVPLIDNYNYNINNYTNELKINAVEYGDVSYYNRFITLVDIYNILTNNPPSAESLTLTDSTATINLINSSTISTNPISFDMTLNEEEIPNIYTLTGTDSLDNSFNATQSTGSSPQTIKIIKGTELTLNITTTTSHPFIIVESKDHLGNDTNIYTTGVTYSSDPSEYETDKGQIAGNIIWDTTNSSLGTYYGICIYHSAMYFKIELVTGIDKTIDTTTNETTIGIDINKYYKMNMSFSFSKNDLELSQNVSDFVIRSESKTYLKFSAKDHPILNLYSNLGLEQEITTTHTALNSNVWYDYYVTLNYDGTNTTGGIYIGKDKQIDYFTNYTITDFTPFKDIGLEYDTLEVRIGINKDEQPVKLNKKIENINIYTKKLNHSTINNLIRNNAISIIPSTTIESNKLELWYRLNDFTNNEFNNEIKDSSSKNKNGSATGTNPTQVITNINSKIKSNKLLKNNFKAMKITDHTFNISTPEIILNNNFTIMIKSKLEIDASEHNIFTYNDLSVDISNTELKVIYGSTTKPITYTFEEKWYAITLMYNKNKTQLSIYINEELKGKYNSVDITSSTNILKLSDYSSKTPPTNIKLSLEDLRILSNEVKYETIYEYANGINVLV